MGFLSNNHIQKFLIGQTISGVELRDGVYWVNFASGERLRLTLGVFQEKTDIIAIPFGVEGMVKQSLQIMAPEEQKGSPKWRILTSVDVVTATDEVMSEDCQSWELLPPKCWLLGKRYEGAYTMPMRRKVPPPEVP